LVAGLACLGLSEACNGSPSAPKPIPPASLADSGGTGAFAIVSVGGTEKLYLPEYQANAAGHSVIAVVDVSAAGDGVRGAPALVTDVDLGPSGGALEYATTTAGNATLVVAASTQNPSIWFIDPITDTLIGKTRLDASYGQSGFSGDGGYVTALVVDAANDRAILAVWNGFAIVDLATQTVSRVILAPPSENFALDPVHERLFAPFYDCTSSLDVAGRTPSTCATTHAADGTSMTDGLNVVDLGNGALYTYQNATADNPDAPVGPSPSGAAVDPTTGLVVVPSKGRQDQSIIDFSMAKFDDATHAVTAPESTLVGDGLTDVAVASATHLGFWEGEDASDVAVARLSTLAPRSERDGGVRDASADAGAEYAFGLLPALPDGGAWMNVVSSHGAAVSPGTTASPPFGITVSQDFRWVARIDLATVLALPATFNEVSDLSSAVTFLDARTKP
jgi:hypothetical protein